MRALYVMDSISLKLASRGYLGIRPAFSNFSSLKKGESISVCNIIINISVVFLILPNVYSVCF
ncbi:hypothetical protein [Vibrio vulnificus YJ016]|uniref:Uncharacterized protein n=1 Tax=Vibrio vulnificus (strain YJ016) TaxID=196600 RepID=Q7MDA9_VIBVY|nr:hypothetical protein [Vibrio vulnificus YJ016]